MLLSTLATKSTVSVAALPKVTSPSNVASVVNVVPPTVVTSPSNATGPGNEVVTPTLPIVIAFAVEAPTLRVPATDESTPAPTASVSPLTIC
jgi:hypothetical protein